ncbi:hypothetical protein CDL12_10752 [Handroanthus impetiginosus]|uniref:Transposase n=1 Tax=Handroanthus impetiginosus TaxID=429701 RepID=A0A2G9HGG1_9LAMI|nr:hypothetical protein CDL12_10752 [Handroanthus impetiginosus]
MLKRRRHACRDRSTPTQPNAEAKDASDVVSLRELVVESAPPVVESGPSIQQDLLDQLDPSIKEDSEVVPDQLYHWRKSNKYWTVRLIDENGETKKVRLMVYDIFPTRDANGLLGQFLGHVTRKFDNFPICYKKWPKVLLADKEHVWNHVIKEKFVVNNGMNKKNFLSSMGNKWKDNCGKLYNTYYDPMADWETNFQNHPEHVPGDQWANFLSYRMRQATKIVSHTLGSKMIARKKLEMERKSDFQILQHGLAKNSSRKHGICRAKMWNIATKKKNGFFVNDETKKKNDLMYIYMCFETETFTKVFSKEHPGRVRSVGHSILINIEIQELKSEVKAPRTQMAYFTEHFGGQILGGHPNNNQVMLVDVSSPTLVRRSPSGSHDPLSLGSHNHGRSSHV